MWGHCSKDTLHWRCMRQSTHLPCDTFRQETCWRQHRPVCPYTNNFCSFILTFMPLCRDKCISERARRSHRASPPPPPPSPPGTFHYGPKIYLRVSRPRSYLFPGHPLGYTGVTALCTRVPSCVHPGADWAQVANASFEALIHYRFVTKWPKCTLKYAWWFLPHRLEQTDTEFKYSLELGEGFRAGTVSRVSGRSHNTTICPIFIIWHISIAYFGKILFQIID